MKKRLVVLAVFTMLVMTIYSAQAPPALTIYGTALMTNQICGTSYVGPLNVDLYGGDVLLNRKQVDVHGSGFLFTISYPSGTIPTKVVFYTPYAVGGKITVPVTDDPLQVNLHFRVNILPPISNPIDIKMLD